MLSATVAVPSTKPTRASDSGTSIAGTSTDDELLADLEEEMDDAQEEYDGVVEKIEDGDDAAPDGEGSDGAVAKLTASRKKELIAEKKVLKSKLRDAQRAKRKAKEDAQLKERAKRRAAWEAEWSVLLDEHAEKMRASGGARRGSSDGGHRDATTAHLGNVLRQRPEQDHGRGHRDGEQVVADGVWQFVLRTCGRRPAARRRGEMRRKTVDFVEPDAKPRVVGAQRKEQTALDHGRVQVSVATPGNDAHTAQQEREAAQRKVAAGESSEPGAAVRHRVRFTSMEQRCMVKFSTNACRGKGSKFMWLLHMRS